MRHLRLGLGLLATTGAFAFAAAPALAHEFIASKEGGTHGASETEQLFKFGAIKIKCLKASAKGHVAAGTSKTYATAIKYAKCLTTAKVGTHEIFLGTRFLTPLAIEYHANGFVETGSELEEVEGKAVIAGGSAELKINTGKTAEGAKSECHLSWPEQTIPLKAERKPEEEYSSATYSNATAPHLVNKSFPDGLQHYIVISNAFKGIKYELEGEPCEEWGKEEGPEGGGGTYFGSFPQLLSGGNLEFQ
ncbi:MAG TPA: hypothetical protein VGO29_10490 [Solirubrobacteraceae bacterium]|jgi:hypothetical protein|nr:hypothetical protein [Solirubrobacteraceae bacterium]